MKFKVGDRVRVVTNAFFGPSHESVGKIGVVACVYPDQVPGGHVDRKYPYWVEFDDAGLQYSDGELELVEAASSSPGIVEELVGMLTDDVDESVSDEEATRLGTVLEAAIHLERNHGTDAAMRYLRETLGPANLQEALKGE